ncbi:hypothetical protein OAN61_01005 [bacterium]|nr:hypothetical protein [bacterium]
MAGKSRTLPYVALPAPYSHALLPHVLILTQDSGWACAALAETQLRFLCARRSELTKSCELQPW